MAQSLRQCNVASYSRVPSSARKAQTVLAPVRAVAIRADASINAVAAEKPPTATTSSSKEKVKIGINGEYRADRCNL